MFLCITMLIIITYYRRTEKVDAPPEGSFCGEIHVDRISPSDATQGHIK